MPKLKTHKGTAKRIKLTATAKLIRRRANGTHFLQKKSSARKRVIASSATVTGKLARNLKRALGANSDAHKSKAHQKVVITEPAISAEQS